MASRSLNKVMLIGNLTRDPELRYTPSGTAVCNFGLATNRSWTSSDSNEKQEETEFHRIVAWQKLAELCAQLLFKGRKVYVEGRIQNRKWTGQDGQERNTTEIIIDNMIVLDSRRKDDSEATEEEPETEPEPDMDAGSGAQSQAKADDKAKAKKPAVAAKDDKKADKKQEKKEEGDPGADEEVKADDIPF